MVVGWGSQCMSCRIWLNYWLLKIGTLLVDLKFFCKRLRTDFIASVLEYCERAGFAHTQNALVDKVFDELKVHKWK